MPKRTELPVQAWAFLSEGWKLPSHGSPPLSTRSSLLPDRDFHVLLMDNLWAPARYDNQF
jgi:hypothetical protein